MTSVSPIPTAFRRRLGLDFTSGLALAAAFVSTPTQAFPGGIATSTCSGCHAESGFDGQITLTPDTPLEPGATTSFTLRVAESRMAGAGFFLTSGGVGQLATVGSGTRLLGGGLGHSRPREAVDGVVEFQFNWTAPAEPGAADFGVVSVAANLNDATSGDRALSVILSQTWGCSALVLYRDGDGDGYGELGETRAACEERAGWVASAEDCNDAWDTIFPGASEIANGRDDDCDGELDEGIEFADLYPDLDGDGFGYRFGESVYGEIGLPGYAPNSEDCDDTSAENNPDAPEICDGYDNDCDDVLDDGAPEICGVGLCTRVLEVCDTACVAGEPAVERCNGFDDDCDGDVDEGELCAGGQVCALACVSPEEAQELGAIAEEVSPATGGTSDAGVAAPSGSTGEPNSGESTNGDLATGGRSAGATGTNVDASTDGTERPSGAPNTPEAAGAASSAANPSSPSTNGGAKPSGCHFRPVAGSPGLGWIWVSLLFVARRRPRFRQR